MGQQTVVGVFDSATDAQRAVQRLQDAGFSRDSFDVASRPAGSAAGYTGSGRDSDHYNASGTMVEGAADSVGRAFESKHGNTGVRDSDHYNESGTMIEGAADRVGRAFENRGSDARDSDHYNASGTRVEGAADRAGRAAEDTGSAIGRFFKNLFGDNEEEASRYSRVASNSGAIVTVHCSSRDNADRAAEILDECGAVDVDERAAQYGYGSTRGLADERLHADDRRYASPDNTTGDATQSMKVIREEVHVGKQEVQTGGARLRSRVVERPVEESLRLREERVFVDREPVNRPATEADFAAFREGTIELRETAEVPVVHKEARVVEEVRLGKESQERTETVRETARSTEVDVERLDGPDADRRDLTDRDNRNSSNL